uniref:Protein-tyrosine sulfotransferase n=1 Tax=Rhodosorus marinus TaxID=101924 RepID=A0A7S3ELZ7_9RHOD|mmetsp:Transcript_5172/g.22228  ORF Transcript_5172/g.22228 Transcript_5172/m.22228 type:complete len:418 (+) Transcript_5172:240-1493(+)
MNVKGWVLALFSVLCVGLTMSQLTTMESIEQGSEMDFMDQGTEMDSTDQGIDENDVDFGLPTVINTDEEQPAVATDQNLDGSEFIPTKFCPGKAESFILGFIGHSGSTALMSILEQHPELNIPFPYEPLLVAVGKPQQSVEIARYLFEQNRLASERMAEGFKVRPGNIRDGEELWEELVNEYQTRLVLNYRDNVFKSAIGLYSIRVRGDLSSQQGMRDETSEEHCEKHPELCRFEVTQFDQFAYVLAKSYITRETTKGIAKMVDWPCIMTTRYEDFVLDPGSEMSKIYDFLGVQRMDLKAKYNKALPDNPCELVSNYQELCRMFWGCEQYRDHLQDPANNCFCDSPPPPPYNTTLCDVDKVFALKKSLCTYYTEKGAKQVVSCDNAQYLAMKEKMEAGGNNTPETDSVGGRWAREFN